MCRSGRAWTLCRQGNRRLELGEAPNAAWQIGSAIRKLVRTEFSFGGREIHRVLTCFEALAIMLLEGLCGTL